MSVRILLTNWLFRVGSLSSYMTSLINLHDSCSVWECPYLVINKSQPIRLMFFSVGLLSANGWKSTNWICDCDCCFAKPWNCDYLPCYTSDLRLFALLHLGLPTVYFAMLQVAVQIAMLRFCPCPLCYASGLQLSTLLHPSYAMVHCATLWTWKCSLFYILDLPLCFRSDFQLSALLCLGFVTVHIATYQACNGLLCYTSGLWLSASGMWMSTLLNLGLVAVHFATPQTGDYADLWLLVFILLQLHRHTQLTF